MMTGSIAHARRNGAGALDKPGRARQCRRGAELNANHFPWGTA
jgi:hypothetical protein